METIKIILADDHPLIREGFKALLKKNKEFEVIGEAENGKELIRIISELTPDILLLDITMPQLNGLEAIAQLKKVNPDIKFIVLTMHEEREYVLNSIKSGASGYLLKNIEREELEKAIKRVYEGGKYFSPSVSNILAETIMKSDKEEITEISPREKEVLRYVAEGNSTKQIASILNISDRTVESHRINLLKKLRVHNTAELIRKATELKLL
ncbi:MAG: response regulator transcription factor [Cytophagaceae bacterium]|nr:response regulator transcription factor [Cytophagaceae bacterium]